MIWRALLFVAAVALFAPQTPDTGIGPYPIGTTCHDGACTVDAGMLGAVKEKMLASLIRVKAEIAADQATRTAGR